MPSDARGPVMHVITGLDVGGAETMLAALAIAEAEAGDPPLVVSLTEGGDVAARLTAAGVPVFDLGMTKGRPGLGGVFRLAGLIRQHRPAILQSWMYHANLVATAGLTLSGRRGAVRHYWGIRCSDTNFGDYGRVFRLIVRAGAWLSRWPDAVACNSEAGIAVHEALGYRPRRFVLVDNGIDTARFKPDADARAAVRQEFGLSPEARIIATAARLDPMKDYTSLLAALDRLPDVTAIVMGDGTKDLPERPNLLRLGRCDRVPQIFAAADAVVSPSAYGEGFSNAIAEGMACGLPAVATDVGDARRIVGEAGRIVKPRDPAALAAAIEAVLDPLAHAETGCAARARIESEFSLRRSVLRFRALHRGEL